MKISVVVLNYNGISNSIECIESLKQADVGKHTLEIVVVDNASNDDSLQKLKNIDDIFLIHNGDNLGYSGGNNVGIKSALKRGADFVCILNNDTKVKKDFLMQMVKHGPKVIVSPKIYFYPGSEFHKKRYKKNEVGKVIWAAGCFVDWANVIGTHRGVDEIDRAQFDLEKEIDFATGACLFASKEIFENTGFFDEKYFLYLEDMDFCIRARENGYKTIYSPKAVVWHKNAASSGGSGSKLQDYYITRNRLLFAFKYAKLKTKLAVLRQTIGQINDQTKKTALFDFLTLHFGKLNHSLK